MREVLLLLLALSFSGVPAARQETLLVKDVMHGVVIMADGTNEYQMPEAEAWRVGDRAECIMLTRGTEDKSDDVIAEARYVWNRRK